MTYVFSSSLEEGLLSLPFYQSLHKKKNLAPFSPPPFFWFPCVYVRMKGHSYKLTRRLKHKETLYNGEMKKENQNRCRNGLQSVQHILFFCYGFIRRIAMLFFFNLSIYTPSKKANRQKTPTKSHHYFSRMSICFCTSLIYSV